ncbi:MAG TPA: VOC family protein [Deinococcales bacterium]|nr:VOC family protein [Deinococcales bacterium]
MEQRLSLVTLGVRDVAASRAFYERLGWRAAGSSGEAIAFFQLGGMALALFGRAELAADATVPDTPGGFAGFTLAHNVRSRAEVDALLAAAVAAGARLVKPGQEMTWGGYSGYFADPDGFLWEVAWNPGFPLDAAGALTVP